MADKAKLHGKTEIFKVFVNDVEELGIAKVTMPETKFAKESVKGSGIGGTIPMTSLHIEERTIKLEFIAVTGSKYELYKPGKQVLDLRHVINSMNSASGEYEYTGKKHLIHAVTNSMSEGEMDSGVKPGGSWEGGVLYQKTTQDGKEMLEIDPLNNVYKVKGTDYYKDIRSALGE